jgi:uncharacterized protein
MTLIQQITRVVKAFLLRVGSASASKAQVPPSPAERSGYRGVFAAAANGDAAEIKVLIAKGEKPDGRDPYGYRRTPLHVAAFAGHLEVLRALAEGGANPNALENDLYDIVTIAAVADDLPTLTAALAIGANAGNVTSR